MEYIYFFIIPLLLTVIIVASVMIVAALKIVDTYLDEVLEKQKSIKAFLESSDK